MVASLQPAFFIGREPQMKEFAAFLQQDNSWILQIIGLPGCGKSSFLQQIRRRFSIKTHNLMTMLDFADSSLCKDRLRVLSEISLSTEGFCSVESVKVFNQRLQQSRLKLIQYHTEQLQKSTNLPDVPLEMQEDTIVLEVQKALLTQLASIERGLKLTILCDTCEKLELSTSKIIVEWLYTNFLPALRRQTLSTIVLVNRAKTVRLPKEFQQTVIDLGPLEKEACFDYMNDIGISIGIREYTYAVTRGHALCFATLCTLWREKEQSGIVIEEDDKEELQQLESEYTAQTLATLLQGRLDKQLLSPLREWTHYGILLRRFNWETLQAVIPGTNKQGNVSREDFSRFIGLPYVQRVPATEGWYCIHEMLRETLVFVIHEQEPLAWQHYHKRAYKYFAKNNKEATIEYEKHYHGLSLEDSRALKKYNKELLRFKTVNDPSHRDILATIPDDKTLLVSKYFKDLLEKDQETFEVQKALAEEKSFNQDAMKEEVTANKEVLQKVNKQIDYRLKQTRLSQEEYRLLRIIVASIIIVGLLLSGIASWVGASLVPTVNQVTTLADDGPGSLRQVVKVAPANSIITFKNTLRGAIQLKTDITIKQNLTIQGPDNVALTIPSPENHLTSIRGRQDQIKIGNDIQPGFRANSYETDNAHIKISSQATVLLANLSFVDSRVKDASFIDNLGLLTLKNCVLEDNISYDNGGAISNQRDPSNRDANYTGATLSIINSAILHNFASSNGGAIYNDSSTLTLANSFIAFNSSYENGGGIYSTGGTVSLSSKTSIIYNQAIHNKYSRGGGITAQNSLLTIDNSSLYKNWSAGHGGGIALLGSVATISSSNLSDDSVDLNNNKIDQRSTQSKENTTPGPEVSVEKDPDSDDKSYMLLTDLSLPPYNAKNAKYTIGQANDDPAIIVQGYKDLTSRPVIENAPTYFDDNNLYGSQAPAPPFIPKKSSSYLKNLKLPVDCETNFSLKIHCKTSSIVSNDPLQLCKETENGSSVQLARLANLRDIESWQCYTSASPLSVDSKNDSAQLGDSMQQSVDKSCIADGDSRGVNLSYTAYGWKCIHSKTSLVFHYTMSITNFPQYLPVGLSVDDICNSQFPIKDTSERGISVLVNYNSPGGWACWSIKKPVS